MNFGIGKIAKKKSTAKKKPVGRPKKVVAKKRGRAATAGSKISASGERYFPSTPKSKKSYRATKTCSAAGSDLKAGINKSAAGAILALCKANVKANNITMAALKKWGVRKSQLSRKK